MDLGEPSVAFEAQSVEETRPRIAVIMASLGRPDDLAHVLIHLKAQTYPPALIILTLEKAEDAPVDPALPVEMVFGPRGLCAQRNRGLDLAKGRADVVVFFDDDYVPSNYALEGVARTFAEQPNVAGATGYVIADGVTIGGIPYDKAKDLVADFDAAPKPPLKQSPSDYAYGCNMAFRSSVVDDIRFDENLPLYGWQEDVDFAGRVKMRGQMILTNSFAGVHCGVTRSRMPGRRLGYSQIVNPIYLIRKGSMQPLHGARLIAMNLIANHAKALFPEPHIDRVGRAIGNWIGLRHVLAGRADPMAVLELSN